MIFKSMLSLYQVAVYRVLRVGVRVGVWGKEGMKNTSYYPDTNS